jgi:thiamine phosphate synthase YjbQ (UPF0047 family)
MLEAETLDRFGGDSRPHGTRSPWAAMLELTPRSRFDAIDVTGRLREAYGDVVGTYRRALYCSYHTTAGYLEPALAARLHDRGEHLDAFMRAYRKLFPAGAGYHHDRMELRRELSEEARRVEPRNADSHLAFIVSGLRNCVTYANRPGRSVYFLELDGVHGAVARTRRTAVLAYDEEHPAASLRWEVPVSPHPIDSVNLADPRLGLMEELQHLVRRCGVEHGRVEIALDAGERDAAVTVNEYETLLMRHDLADVLRDPLRWVVRQGRRAFADPGAIPAKSVGYATYDVVQVLKEVIDAFGLSESLLERLLARVMALPASRLLRLKRSTSLLVGAVGDSPGGLLRGTYQSPILLQWSAAPRGSRGLVISLKRFR